MTHAPAFMLFAAQFLPVTPADEVSISVNPPTICATGNSSTYLNFDLIVANHSAADLTIASIQARSFGPSGDLLEHRIVWQDSLSLLGDQRTIKAKSDRLLYNPFSFETAARADRIDYILDFHNNRSATTTVRPQSCLQKARLISPLAGRILIYDGYDFLSHHRRMTWHDRDEMRANRVIDNVYRFGIDLLVIDAGGKLFRGKGDRNEDWFGWGAPVRASAAGVVTAVRDDMPDNALGNEDYPRKRLSEDQMNSDGNYVQVDHGNGEISTFTHLKAGSARVKVGQRVTADQVVGLVGNSGATSIPHLHYELRSGFGVQGVRSAPAYFYDLRLVGRDAGDGPVALDTGDVYISP